MTDTSIAGTDAERPPEPAQEQEEPARKRQVPVEGAKLHFGRLKEAAQVRTHWYADVPSGAVRELVEMPTYWVHYARLLRPLDLIEVVCEDGTWEALYRVMFVGDAEVRLSRLRHTTHTTASPIAAVADVYDIAWKGPSLKWCVVLKEGGKIVKDRLYPRDKAVEYMQKHLKTIGG